MNQKLPDYAQDTVHMASVMWDQAAGFVEEAKSLNQPFGNRHAVGAIVLAALSAEGFINELAHFASEQPPFGNQNSLPGYVTFGKVGQVVMQLEEDHCSTVAKYRVFSAMLPGPHLVADREPLQSLMRLFALRNDIVHQKCVTRAPKYMKDFEDRGWTVDGKRQRRSAPGWFFQIQTPEVGAWACIASRAAVLHIYAQLKELANGNAGLDELIDFPLGCWDSFRADARIDWLTLQRPSH